MKMKRVFRTFVHPHPPGPILHFRDVARVDLVVMQRRNPLQALALRFAIPRFSICAIVRVTVLARGSLAFFIQLPLHRRRFAGFADDNVRSPETLLASSKPTPCFAALARSMLPSLSNRTVIPFILVHTAYLRTLRTARLRDSGPEANDGKMMGR